MRTIIAITELRRQSDPALGPCGIMTGGRFDPPHVVAVYNVRFGLPSRPVVFTVPVIPPTICTLDVIKALPVVRELPAIAMQMPRLVIIVIIFVVIISLDKDGADHAPSLEARSSIKVGQTITGTDTGSSEFGCC